jgi:hypothetical protein
MYFLVMAPGVQGLVSGAEGQELGRQAWESLVSEVPEWASLVQVWASLAQGWASLAVVQEWESPTCQSVLQSK